MQPRKPRQVQPGKGKGKEPTPDRDEFEVAYYTKELGRPLQRKLLQQQLEVSGSGATAAHGEDSCQESQGNPPQQDRAG